MKILIDNGHGKETKGKGSPYSLNKVPPELPFMEYQWTREVASAIVDTLNNEGYDAELLVPEENDISLSQRVKRVNNWCQRMGAKNVVLVSIHNDAEGIGTKWGKANGFSAMVYNGASENSKRLASLITQNIEASEKRVRRQYANKDYWAVNLYILKNTKCPSVLTENFFQTNIDDVTFLCSEEGKNICIDSHVKALKEYMEQQKSEK